MSYIKYEIMNKNEEGYYMSLYDRISAENWLFDFKQNHREFFIKNGLHIVEKTYLTEKELLVNYCNKIKERHIYKSIGKRDNYLEYNQGVRDTIDSILEYLDDEPKQESEVLENE